jgi:hypothetical protein
MRNVNEYNNTHHIYYSIYVISTQLKYYIDPPASEVLGLWSTMLSVNVCGCVTKARILMMSIEMTCRMPLLSSRHLNS